MNHHKKTKLLGLMVCGLLTACGSSAKQYPYVAPAAHGGQPATIDNDSYYSQPGSYMPAPTGGYGGCNQINDAPSCGGG